YSGEPAMSHGYTKATGMFRDYWYFYQTEMNGEHEFPDTQPLSQGVQHLVAIRWFYRSTPTPHTDIIARGQDYVSGTPSWTHTVTDPDLWSANDFYISRARGETNNSCSSWNRAYWAGMKWTDGMDWFTDRRADL